MPVESETSCPHTSGRNFPRYQIQRFVEAFLVCCVTNRQVIWNVPGKTWKTADHYTQVDSTRSWTVDNRHLVHLVMSLCCCYVTLGHIFISACMYGLLTKWEVKMAGYWPSSFFACLWTEKGPISSHLDWSNLVNKGLIIWLLAKFCLRDTAGSPERARWPLAALAI